MVSAVLRSRSFMLLLLSLSPSSLPCLPLSLLPAFTKAFWPLLALSVLRTQKVTTAPVTERYELSGSGDFAAPVTLKSSSSVLPMTLSSRTSITASQSTSVTSFARKFGPDEAPPDASLIPVRCSRAFRPFGQMFPVIQRFLPHLCKLLVFTISHKTPPSPEILLSFTEASAAPFLHKTVTFPVYLPTVFPLSDTSPLLIDQTSPDRVAGTFPSFPPRLIKHRFPPLTAAPLFQNHPFIVTWNIPNLVCTRHNITLDTSPFKGVATPGKVPDQFLSLFYKDRLGLYPHVDFASERQINGGIPQKANLEASVKKARADINYYIPSETKRGLAVIDWEDWRPLWDRNWGSKQIYQSLSVAHVVRCNRTLTVQQAAGTAKRQFQEASRRFMSETLTVGTTMRPNYLWGFYLFPHCYNYGWEEPGYTGHCSEEVRRQNDQLLWLWESSTALYPSVYLQVSLADSPNAALMVRNRVQEALRVSALPRRTTAAPVFVYTRPVFLDQNRRFLSQGDLVHTVGESAAVGASGSVLWGASADYDDQASCEALSSYLSSVLNPYVTNVTAAAQLCSNFLCRGNGRCVRKNYNSNHYLHLNPENFKVIHVPTRYLVLGKPTLGDLKAFGRSFTCQCYKGLSCTPRTYRELAKALAFSEQQRWHQKACTHNKDVLDDTQQASIAKQNVEKDLGCVL